MEKRMLLVLWQTDVKYRNSYQACAFYIQPVLFIVCLFIILEFNWTVNIFTALKLQIITVKYIVYYCKLKTSWPEIMLSNWYQIFLYNIFPFINRDIVHNRSLCTVHWIKTVCSSTTLNSKGRWNIHLIHWSWIQIKSHGSHHDSKSL